jgi:nucleotide-binding universal stress UspA family protein
MFSKRPHLIEFVVAAALIAAPFAHDKLRMAVARAEARGVTMKTAVSVSDGVADAIIAAAVQHGSDLIVMASHGRSGFAKLLTGSDTDQVLANSKVPVLVIR